MFDWPSFLQRNRIPTTTTGPNASRGTINTKCPFCGQSDPSEHLGISLSGQGYYCFRNRSHGGKSNVRLVRAFLRCDEATARRIVYGDASTVPTEDTLVANSRRLKAVGRDVATVEDQDLRFPKEFKSLLSDSIFAQPFLSYLRQRGYSGSNLEWLISTYRLHYVVKGLFAYRLIIPVYARYGELLTWTGRTIRRQEEPRYRALGMPKPDRDPPFAKSATKDTLLGLPLLWSVDNAKVLVIVEGPFDAWRITSVGRGLGVYATCVFGATVQASQLDLLHDLAGRFKKRVLLIDPDQNLQRLRLYEQLAPIGVEVSRLRADVKDPAELSTDQVLALCVDLLSS